MILSVGGQVWAPTLLGGQEVGILGHGLLAALAVARKCGAIGKLTSLIKLTIGNLISLLKVTSSQLNVKLIFTGPRTACRLIGASPGTKSTPIVSCFRL